MQFRDLLHPCTKLSFVNRRISFAEIALSMDNISNGEVFVALSHLAELDELDIDINYYINMQYYPYRNRLNVDTYLEALSYLDRAHDIQKRLNSEDNYEG